MEVKEGRIYIIEDVKYAPYLSVTQKLPPTYVEDFSRQMDIPNLNWALKYMNGILQLQETKVLMVLRHKTNSSCYINIFVQNV